MNVSYILARFQFTSTTNFISSLLLLWSYVLTFYSWMWLCESIWMCRKHIAQHLGSLKKQWKNPSRNPWHSLTACILNSLKWSLAPPTTSLLVSQLSATYKILSHRNSQYKFKALQKRSHVHTTRKTNIF